MIKIMQQTSSVFIKKACMYILSFVYLVVWRCSHEDDETSVVPSRVEVLGITVEDLFTPLLLRL